MSPEDRNATGEEKTFTERLQDYIRRSGISQQELARRIRMARPAIRRVQDLGPYRLPSWPITLAIVRACGMEEVNIRQVEREYEEAFNQLGNWRTSEHPSVKLKRTDAELCSVDAEEMLPTEDMLPKVSAPSPTRPRSPFIPDGWLKR